jgi:hypothetical protein
MVGLDLAPLGQTLAALIDGDRAAGETNDRLRVSDLLSTLSWGLTHLSGGIPLDRFPELVFAHSLTALDSLICVL